MNFMETNEAFHDACINGDLEAIKILVSQGVDVNAYHGGAVDKACKRGHLEVVKFLVLHGCRMGFMAYYAASNGHLELVKFLISQSIGEKHFFATGKAIMVCDLKALKCLVAHGYSFRDGNDNVIIYAISRDEFEMARYLDSIGIEMTLIPRPPEGRGDVEAEKAITAKKIANFVLHCYDIGYFDFAAKLLKHKFDIDDTIKKSLTKIQKDRSMFRDNLRKNNYVDALIFT